MGRTLAEKVWDQHVVRHGEGQEPDLLYIDLHLVHEVTSPQAFDGLRLAGRPVKFPGSPQRPVTAPPTMGQHTAEVLRDLLGYTDADIAALRESGVIDRKQK